jgi:hypothetical protein
MDVPDMNSYESRTAAKMLTPGAAMSGCCWFQTKALCSRQNSSCLLHKYSPILLTYGHPFTLSMAGNSTLGPLDENEAILGDSTLSPTTVVAGEILTTGVLPWHVRRRESYIR